jgi:hypothetical protein
VCALAHFLEAQAMRTFVVGLIRKHVERMRPPRALAVPFELGRPMGAPNQPAFQRRVLTALLELHKAPVGPVLVEFPDPAPGPPADLAGWVCPITLAAPPPADSEQARLRAALEAEIERLRPWHAESEKQRGRSTVGISGLAIDKIPALISAFTSDLALKSPQEGVPTTVVVKRATDDLKAFYYEAATAKPGHITDVMLGDWLWGETAAGRAMLALRKVCLTSEDPAIKNLGQLQLLPNHQRDKRK